MFIFCKDAKPKDTIKRIKSILRKAGFEVEEASWKHPAPHVWSVHVREKSCPVLFSNGKGMTRELALASALGEFIERLNTGYFFSHHALHGFKQPSASFFFFPKEKWFPAKNRRLPKGVLDEKLRAFYDTEGELASRHLVDRMSGKKDICTVPFTRVRDSKAVYFPLNLLDNLYASNGMAAGNTFDEACVQALSEIIERYVKNKIISEGLALPEIPLCYYKKYQKVTAAISSIKKQGFGLRVTDASLGGRYPVINITLIEKSSSRCFLAFGAHPSFEVALTRTLTELLQGQDLKHFNGFQKLCRDLVTVADPANLEAHFIDSSGLVSWRFFKKKADFSFQYMDFEGTRQEEFDYLVSLIHKDRKDVYIADFMQSGFFCCRVVVPGMSEIYPPADLVFANNNLGAELCAPLMRLKKLSRKELSVLLRTMERGMIRDDENVSQVTGFSVDSTSPWAELYFGELKMLIQLKLGKKKAAKNQLMWCLDTGYIRDTKRLVYECLLLILDGQDCISELVLIFLEGVLKKACCFAKGRDLFDDLFTKSGSPVGANVHQRLVKAFDKARRMKLT